MPHSGEQDLPSELTRALWSFHVHHQDALMTHGETILLTNLATSLAEDRSSSFYELLGHLGVREIERMAERPENGTTTVCQPDRRHFVNPRRYMALRVRG